MVGQKFLMGCRFLERWVVMRNSLFNRQLTGKKQAFEKFTRWILGGVWQSSPSSEKYPPKTLQIPYAEKQGRYREMLGRGWEKIYKYGEDQNIHLYLYTNSLKLI